MEISDMNCSDQEHDGARRVVHLAGSLGNEAAASDVLAVLAPGGAWGAWGPCAIWLD